MSLAVEVSHWCSQVQVESNEGLLLPTVFPCPVSLTHLMIGAVNVPTIVPDLGVCRVTVFHLWCREFSLRWCFIDGISGLIGVG
ncbi:hypothetical protein [Kocuria sp.]|uniref:hypothetical protein n=1 Tax=Kocuria sp. TaxID=1871328 RepID=UPI0026DEB9E4|nr:hypothetical protein [Kocuria sp.]MDO5619752.1 hypothetical protein [Kocuria sp.]